MRKVTQTSVWSVKSGRGWSNLRHHCNNDYCKDWCYCISWTQFQITESYLLYLLKMMLFLFLTNVNDGKKWCRHLRGSLTFLPLAPLSYLLCFPLEPFLFVLTSLCLQVMLRSTQVNLPFPFAKNPYLVFTYGLNAEPLGALTFFSLSLPRLTTETQSHLQTPVLLSCPVPPPWTPRPAPPLPVAMSDHSPIVLLDYSVRTR